MSGLQIASLVVDGLVNFTSAAAPAISSGFLLAQTAANTTTLTTLTAVNAGSTAIGAVVLATRISAPLLKLAGRIAWKTLSGACKVVIVVYRYLEKPAPKRGPQPQNSGIYERKPTPYTSIPFLSSPPLQVPQTTTPSAPGLSPPVSPAFNPLNGLEKSAPKRGPQPQNSAIYDRKPAPSTSILSSHPLKVPQIAKPSAPGLSPPPSPGFKPAASPAPPLNGIA